MYLAIDAGGTKADYVLADDHAELARARSGSIKRMRVDAPTATAHLEAGLDELRRLSGRSLAEVQHICIGTAGETVPLVVDWLRSVVPTYVGGALEIVGDVEIALDAAFQGKPGVLVLAGTGSNVAGRLPDGTLAGAGGWGPALADQGSGNRIGHTGLRAGFLARDEGRQTVLLKEAMRFWQLGSEEELVAYANSVPAPDFSKLSRAFVRCAEEGDPVAAEVLAREGQDLAYLARLVLRRIVQAAEGQPVSLGLAFAGSIMEHVAPVREALAGDVRSEFPDIVELPGVVDPVLGALWRARRHTAAKNPGAETPSQARPQDGQSL